MTTTAPSKTPLAYQVITDRIIQKLEQGVVPWQLPWNARLQAPRNFETGRRYRGANIFMLVMSSFCQGYLQPHWLTYKQAQALGGQVRAGEKATPVVFWTRWTPKSKGSDAAAEGDFLGGDGEVALSDAKEIPILKYYSAFNVEQIDGLDVPEVNIPKREHSPLDEAERIVASMPRRPEIKHGGARAGYRPRLDDILIPSPEYFKSAPAYYSTLFHELGHATGHPSRLNRRAVADVAEGRTAADFGGEVYSHEELVAEMTAAFLNAEAGTFEDRADQNAAYCQGWIDQLKQDPKSLVIAAAQAQKAADFILNRSAEQQGQIDAQEVSAA